MPTRVLGIDPGIAMMGYAVIDQDNDNFITIDFGCLTTSAQQTIPERLHIIYWNLLQIIERYQPSEAAVELFVARNLRAALMVGQARGVAILAAANKGMSVFEYTPLQVKQRVSGYGRGNKKQIQEMVRIILGLDSIPKPDDAADALAIAICHLNEVRLSRILSA